jgi:nucleoside-diphosphate-sugar epimerase
MRVFVTGGTGFIGSNFINHATDLNVEIVAQKRIASKPRVEIKKPEKVKWVVKELDGDLTEELKECDAVIHFAAYSVLPPYKPLSDCLYWNVYTTVKLLEQAESVGVKNIIIAGSCFEYGSSANNYLKIPPDAKLLPNDSYSISKAFGSEACIGYARDKEIKLQILRIFQAYGDGENENRFWPSLKRAALSGEDFPMSSGEQIRHFIHVSKICEEFFYALNDKSVEYGRPIIKNIAEGEGVSLIDFANSWWLKFQAKGKLKPGAKKIRNGELMRIVAEINTVNKL